jgi:hypothetical protein
MQLASLRLKVKARAFGVMVQFAVAALYERRILLKKKPAVIDRRY